MIDKKFPDFNIPEDKNAGQKPSDTAEFDNTDMVPKEEKSHIVTFFERKFGPDSKVTHWMKKLNLLKTRFSKDKDNPMNQLSHIQTGYSFDERFNLILTLILMALVFFTWKSVPGLLKEADQLKNDLVEQSEVIEMETRNNEFLEKLQQDRNTLIKNIHTVYAAIPDDDEKAEEVISMLENIAAKNRMVIEAIGIRAVPDSQFYYDDLIGYVQPYEYTFSVENGLPYILSFIESLRNSLRLMDIMTLEIEEGKNSYKANFSVYAYHILGEEDYLESEI